MKAKKVPFQLYFSDSILAVKMKPEDQWSCKRSPDILILAQNIQNLEKTKSRNNLDLQYSLSFTELVVCITIFHATGFNNFLKYPLFSHYFPIEKPELQNLTLP